MNPNDVFRTERKSHDVKMYLYECHRCKSQIKVPVAADCIAITCTTCKQEKVWHNRVKGDSLLSASGYLFSAGEQNQ